MGTVEGIRRPTTRAQQLRREATPAERRLWSAINAGQLGVRFSRQMPVGPYVCDFLCRSGRLVIELDGVSHDISVAVDTRRDSFIRARGVEVLRFTNAEVLGNLDGVVTTIRLALGQPHPQPPPARGRGRQQP